MRHLFRVDVDGLERVPSEGAAILATNHRSPFDTPLVLSMAPRPVVFLGETDDVERWAARRLLPAIGVIPVDRHAETASSRARASAVEILGEGGVVGIYPEGTPSLDGDLHRGHSGVAHLAMTSGAPIVPVGIVGSHRVQPVGSPVPRPFRGPVRLRFGEPIRPEQYRAGGSRHRRARLVDDVMAAIASLTNQRRSPDFSSTEPPLIRGGSESVYLVTTHRAAGLSWHQAAERTVDQVCQRYDDARVGEVRELSCRIMASGQIEFGAELSLSTKFRGTSS